MYLYDRNTVATINYKHANSFMELLRHYDGTEFEK